MNVRNQSLDVLRGVAILLVLCCHAPNAQLLRQGWIGVDLFFVLSGFLISGLLFAELSRTGTINVVRFWIRRGFKIYPSFYALLALTAIFFVVTAGGIPKEILGDVLFLQGYFPHVWSHGWSLAVEEHFYLSLPLIIIVLARLKAMRLLPFLSIAASVGCFYMRLVTWNHSRQWEVMFFPTHLRFDALLAGVAIGYYAAFDAESFKQSHRKWVLTVGLSLVTVGLILPLVLSLTFVYIGFAFVVAWAANCKSSNNILVKAIAWIGGYSYSIYVWHVLAVIGFMRFHLTSWPLYFLAASLPGVLMAEAIEVPLLKFRDRRFPPAKKNPHSYLPLELEGTTVAVMRSS